MTDPMFARSETALWHRTSGRTLINPAEGRENIELTGVAAVVWEGLGEPVSTDDLVADLAAVFERPAGAIRSEVEVLLGGLIDAGVVRLR